MLIKNLRELNRVRSATQSCPLRHMNCPVYNARPATIAFILHVCINGSRALENPNACCVNSLGVDINCNSLGLGNCCLVVRTSSQCRTKNKVNICFAYYLIGVGSNFSIPLSHLIWYINHRLPASLAATTDDYSSKVLISGLLAVVFSSHLLTSSNVLPCSKCNSDEMKLEIWKFFNTKSPVHVLFTLLDLKA